MKLHALEMKGIGRHHEHISLPVSELGSAGVVAITGLNGSGKTTLIEGLIGLLYGEVPSHGLLAAMANAKDSHVMGVVETDQIYRALRKINGVRKSPKTEAYLFDAAGTPLNDGKQSTFDAEVAKRFPSERVYLASGFAAQGRKGQFLEVSKSERKALFAEMLGLGPLQSLSEAAGKRAAGIDADLAGLRARVGDIRERAGRLDALRGELAEATETRDARAREVAELQEQMRAARKAGELWGVDLEAFNQIVAEARVKWGEAKAVVDGLARDATRRDAELVKVATERGRLTTRLGERAELERVIGEGDPDARLREIDAEIVTLRQAEIDHRVDFDGWTSRELVARDAVLKAERGWEQALERAETAMDQARERASAMKALAASLAGVPCGGVDSESIDYSACPLIATATRARDNLEAAQDEATRSAWEVDTVKGGRELIDTAGAKHQAVEAEKPTEPDTARIPELEAEAKAWREVHARNVEASAKLDALTEVELRAGELDDEAVDLRNEIEDGGVALVAARGALEAAGTAGVDARAILDAHKEKKPPEPDQGRLDELHDIDGRAMAEVSRIEEAVRAAEASGMVLKKVESEISAKVVDLDDWRHLQKALGRDGIQALEVDAAGPEVSDLINELLHSCFGSRFSAALETTALRADGKGTKEIFDLRVVDSEMGVDGSASDLSGGERVIVAEALSLAIAIYNSRRSSIPILDLWRDEVAGALDYEKAPLYVTMLRRALTLGDFHRVYFIAHAPALWPLADARINVFGGECCLVD